MTKGSFIGFYWLFLDILVFGGFGFWRFTEGALGALRFSMIL
jgi:hypothetical protein